MVPLASISHTDGRDKMLVFDNLGMIILSMVHLRLFIHVGLQLSTMISKLCRRADRSDQKMSARSNNYLPTNRASCMTDGGAPSIDGWKVWKLL